MFLQISQVTDKLFTKAINYFPKTYLETLKNKPKESVIARYLVSKSIN